MRRALLFGILLFCLPLLAQRHPTAIGGGGTGTGVVKYTVATLPTSAALRTIVEVTDGLSNQDCTSGGGAGIVPCMWNGSAWVAIVVQGASSISTGTAPVACGGATGCFAATAASTASTQTAGQGSIRLDTSVWKLRQTNAAAETQIATYADTLAAFAAGALASGTTATTQSANDNSTKVATTAYVNAIAAGAGAIYQGVTSVTHTVNGARMVNVLGGYTESGAATSTQAPLVGSGTFTKFCMYRSVAPGGTATEDFVLNINGSDVTGTVSFAAGTVGRVCQTISAPYTDGQLIYMKLTVANQPTAASSEYVSIQ